MPEVEVVAVESYEKDSSLVSEVVAVRSHEIDSPLVWEFDIFTRTEDFIELEWENCRGGGRGASGVTGGLGGDMLMVAAAVMVVMGGISYEKEDSSLVWEYDVPVLVWEFDLYIWKWDCE